MSTELINRITVKKDGVYLSSHSSNDTAPFHSWRCKSLSEIYAAEGQAGLDREIVCMSYITNVGAGQGLLKVGSSLVPFVNKFPRNTELYKLMTTKFGEV